MVFILILLTTLATIGGAVWQHNLNVMPVVVVPYPVMPHPNAFDFYVAAGNVIRDAKKIDAAVAPNSSVSQSKKAALVRENAPALSTLRAGFAFPYQEPPARTFNAQFPNYLKERETARLLRLEGQTKAAQGDWAGAIKSDLDAIQMGEEIPHGSPQIGMLAGLACQSIGQRDAWQTINHLNAAEARAAVRRLAAIQKRHVPFAATLQEEKWWKQASMLILMRQPNWFNSVGGLLPVSKKMTLLNFTRYMDQNIANAQLPYAAKLTPPTVPGDLWCQVFAPIFSGARLRDTDIQAQSRMLQIALAVRAFRLEHRAYPASMNALVPAYLPAAPDDPFALSGPLRYRRTTSGYLLYSVGPDGKDDNGRAILHAPTAHGPEMERSRRYVQPDSQGDIVAGVNF